MERRITRLVVTEVDGNISSPLLPVVIIRVCLEDELFDRYLPCRVRDKFTPQRCDNSLHLLLCLLIGINGMVAEMVQFFFFAFEKTAILIYIYFRSFRRNFLVLWTQRFNAFVAFYLIKYLHPFVESSNVYFLKDRFKPPPSPCPRSIKTDMCL